MIYLFLACAVAGCGALLLRMALPVLTHRPGYVQASAPALLTVHSLAAGVAFFGMAGLAVMRGGRPAWLALPAASSAGLAAAGAAALAAHYLRPHTPVTASALVPSATDAVGRPLSIGGSYDDSQ